MTTRTHPTNTHATPHPTRTGCPATPHLHPAYVRAWVADNRLPDQPAACAFFDSRARQ